VLVMTVNPGFSGQQFIQSTLPKISRIRQLSDARELVCELEVDGGLDEFTAPLAVNAGANVLVAGSAIFQTGRTITDSLRRLVDAAESATPGSLERPEEG